MRIRASTSDSSNDSPTGSRLYAALGLLAAGLAISLVILSWTPPVSRDALTHHLVVPKLYIEGGGIHEIPSIPFSYYPMNLDLLYMIPLYFGNDILPKYIHFSFALLTCWLIFRYLKRRTSPVFAMLGVVLFLSLPVVIKLSITVYVDLGLIFFSTAALLAFLNWVENGYRRRDLLLSALWCGLALGCKYNGIITFVLLTLFIPFVYSRGNRDAPGASARAIGFGAVFFLTTLLIFSPWMVRNIIWKNNPVHPLFTSVFKARTAAPGRVDRAPVDGAAPGPSVHAAGGAARAKKPSGSFSNFALRRMIYKESWLQIALIPIRIFFQGQDDDPKYFDGRLNPILFLFPFLAFSRRQNDSRALIIERKILLTFSGLFLLYAFAQTDMRIRYVGPIIPPLVILSILGLERALTTIRERCAPGVAKAAGWSVMIAFSFLLSLNAIYLVEQFRRVDPSRYIFGNVSRDAYIEKRRPEYAALMHANEHLPPDARILAFFLGNRRYYSDREMIFKINIFKKAVIPADSPSRISERLNKAGVTHLLIRYDAFNFWVKNNFDDRQKALISAFFKEKGGASAMFSKGGWGLYRCAPAGERRNGPPESQPAF